MRGISLIAALVLPLVFAGCSSDEGVLPADLPDPLDPTVTLTSSGNSVAVGGSVTLTWSSTNATTCVASGDWSGDRAIAGSEAVTVARAGANSYTLTCTGANGSAAATVSVTGTSDPTPPPAPTVSLTADKLATGTGQTITLTWSSTGATTCTASGEWSGAKATTGTQTGVPVPHVGLNSYTLTCTGAGGSTAQTLSIVGVSRYALAGGCFALQSLDTGKFVALNGASYHANAAPGGARAFRMQAAGLGRYVFYPDDDRYLTASSTGPGTGTVADAADPVDGSDWTVDTTDDGRFTVAALDLFLATNDAGNLVMAGEPGYFTFVPAANCKTYPEMPVGISGTFTGPAEGRLYGFADIHAHMAMGSDMSDGSGDRGPSAAGVMYGHAVNRFGVIEAVKDCTEMHGENGSTTAEIVLDANPDGRHETAGWPTFNDWPAPDSLLHQQMYWKWVERTYQAGLRLMVLHGTNIEALCDVAKKSSGSKTSDCSDMGVGMKQVAYAHDMEKYIDAQYGGPGKGWFRIVKDPDEAEAVIRAGKMAVVPGLEFSNIFQCNVTYQGSRDPEKDGDPATEVVGCTKEMIDQQIDEVWDAGVRGVFLYHDVDSALGGTGIFSEVLNLVNYYGTKGWWQTYTCNDEWGDPAVDKGYFYGAGAVMLGMGQMAPLLDNPMGEALIASSGGSYPVYPPGRQCNARGTTELGRYALEAVMKKGFVLDIDHAEISIKQDMLDVGAESTPDYPMISAHGGHGGFTNAQVLQMLRQGGIMYPGMVNGLQYIGFHDKVEAIWNQMTPEEKAAYPLAVGYGADQNGLANQPGGDDEDLQVDYGAGIKLFEGPGWDPGFAAAGIAPVTVAQLVIPGGHNWNINLEGVAHYGLIPDVVEQIRLESKGNVKYLDDFYRSADAYVRLWKQTRDAALDRPEPTPPDPAKVPPFVPHPIDPSTGEPPSP